MDGDIGAQHAKVEDDSDVTNGSQRAGHPGTRTCASSSVLVPLRADLRPGRRGTMTARRRLLPARRRTHLLLCRSIPWCAACRVARRRLAMTSAISTRRPGGGGSMEAGEEENWRRETQGTAPTSSSCYWQGRVGKEMERRRLTRT
jgi:hypothetical protein